MKKYLLLVLMVAIFTVGCGNDKKQEPVYQQAIDHTNSEQGSVDINSEEYKFHAYALQKAVAAFAKGIKYSGENCQMTSEGIAKCFSKYMSGSSIDKNIVRDSHDGTWQFVINNNCQNKEECKILINTENGEFIVELWVDNDGFLTTDNPHSPY